MKVLGIETSCDETSAAVVEDGMLMLSNSVVSSLDLFIEFGGVVPEIAARSHVEVILPVINNSLETAGASWDDIDAIAVTAGPGLIGSLLVGTLTARSLAVAKQKPLWGVNHVQAHVYANFITKTTLPGYRLSSSQPGFPLLALIVSGGHTQLVLFTDHSAYKLLGQTADDAIGEAFDKVAKLLGLPYPGGPSIAKAAKSGNAGSVKLPKAKMGDSYNFSFSGLKTAVLRAAQEMSGHDYSLPSSRLPSLLTGRQKADLAASFQKVAAETLVEVMARANKQFLPKSLIIAGGVAANEQLRTFAAEKMGRNISYPDIKLCTDNAAMIASLGYFAAKTQKPADPYSLEVKPGLSM